MNAVEESSPGGSATETDTAEAGPPDEADDRAGEPASSRQFDTHRPDHWQLAGTGALFAAGAGLVVREPALFLVSIVAVGMLAVRQLSTPPEPEVTVGRSFSVDEPEPGERVEVETTIQNVGEQSLPDCRFVDRVPGEVRVTAGSPRIATRLGPDEECTLGYEVEVDGGNHRFDGVYAVVSDRTGTHEHEYDLDAADDVRCRRDPRPLRSPVLRRLTSPYAGRLATEKPGEGLEFYAVREYRTGDPVKRIDWNQYASNRELATLQFRTERSAAVVLLVDIRKPAYTRTNEADRHAADRGIEAATRLLVTLLDADHRVGIATLGPDYWLPPGDGSNHRDRALDALSFESAFSSRPPEAAYPTRLRTLRLLQRLTEPTQVVICTPLVDDMVEVPIQLLESVGHEVTVLSPDPTAMESRGGIVATLERRARINRIHGYGVPVVDWEPDTSLDVAAARTMEGWSE